MPFITTSSLQVTRLIAGILLLLPSLLFAHNNPEFISKTVSSIQIELIDFGSSERANSAEFIITSPKETIRIVWKVNSENKDKILFSVKQGDKVIAKDIQDGSETDPNLINGDMLVITDVKGAEAAFKLDILARVIVDKKKKKSADTSVGKRVYKKANCMGCHKWHGAGGGGYGGAALSLRTTQLSASFIKYTVRCGRPETGMPYHGRKSYKADDVSCYDVTGEEMAKDKPPRARSFLSERDLDAVVKYVVSEIKGSGEPNFDQCIDFWGEKSRQCNSFK